MLLGLGETFLSWILENVVIVVWVGGHARLLASLHLFYIPVTRAMELNTKQEYNLNHIGSTRTTLALK